MLRKRNSGSIGRFRNDRQGGGQDSARRQRRYGGSAPFESLEARQVLSGSPVLVADLNETPAEFGAQTLLWAAEDGTVALVQQDEFVRLPQPSSTSIHLFDLDSDQASYHPLAGELADLDVGADQLRVSVVDQWGNLQRYVTDGPTVRRDFVVPKQLGELDVQLDASGVPYLVELGHDENRLIASLASSDASQAEYKVTLQAHWAGERQVEMEGQTYVRIRRGSETELWATDGTTEGTERILQVRGMSGLTVMGKRLVFSAADRAGSRHLWYSDGTAAGTQMVISDDLTPLRDNFFPLAGSASALLGVTESGGQYTMWHAGQTLHPEPLSTTSVRPTIERTEDGIHFRSSTAAGEPLVWYIDGASAHASLSNMVHALQGPTFNLEIVRDPGSGQFQLWRNGPDLVTLLADGLADDARFLDAEDAVYLVSGHELWRSDGTAVGTQRVVSLPLSAEQIRSGEVVGSSAVILGDRELYEVSFDQTVPVETLLEHATNQDSHPLLLGTGGNRALFVVAGPDRVSPDTLWTSDGTAEGTRPLLDDVDVLEAWTIGNSLYFVQRDGDHRALWRSQGTADTTQKLLDITQYGEVRLLETGDRVVILVGYEPVEVWISEGTPESTRHVTSVPTGYSGWPRVPEAAMQGDKLVLPVGDCIRDMACAWWVIDLQAAEPTPQRVEVPGVQYLRGLRAVDQRVYFVGQPLDKAESRVYYLDEQLQAHATDVSFPASEELEPLETEQGYTLVASRWVSFSTRLLSLISTESAGLIDFAETTMPTLWDGQRVHYVVDSPDVPQRSFYATDGTEAGTVKYYQDKGVDDPNGVLQRTVIDGKVYLTTHNGIWLAGDETSPSVRVSSWDGLELAKSPHPRHGRPFLVSIDADTVLAVADTPQTGTELFRFDLKPDRLTADLNGDGAVDFADFLHLSNNIGRTHDAVFADGDLDGDGAVTMDDFELLQAEFGERVRFEIK